MFNLKYLILLYSHLLPSYVSVYAKTTCRDMTSSKMVLA